MNIKPIKWEGSSCKDLSKFSKDAKRRLGSKIEMSKQNKIRNNVFEDLGFDPAEAANLKIRSDLMLEIRRYIEKNSLTQKKAAELMGVDQPRISKLLKGKIELFTIDILIQMLERAGIHIVLKRAA